MSEWQTCAVPDSFVKNKVGRQNQIPAKDITDVGRFPVIDQGQKFVAGYCDDESKVIDFDLPLIIFGDHTRCFKFVDFPFVLGADGTKVLLPNKELYDPRFYYFAMLSLELPNRGYNRHFKSLKEGSLPLPPLPEQKKIAHILSTVQRAIETQERIIQTTTELKKALMHKLFTEGLRNEPQKQTEIGHVPESWEVVAFDKFVTLQRGYDLRKQDFREGEVPVIGATKVIGYHDTSNVKAPGVTVVRSGSSAGKPLFIAEDFWAHNVLLYVKDFQGNVPKFVYYKILALDLTQYRQGVAVPTLNRNTFSAIELALPSPEEQQEIADALDRVANRTEAAERKKHQLQDLFRTLLHELMTAKTRVHELEITA
ncbi:MAG: restriction endonuclease subunit S [Pseudomonadaceae bacterium]|nr:restriction endonuclease subunit S [Pseudomonadaceae bacterium]